jgi:hypothetical protein
MNAPGKPGFARHPGEALFQQPTADQPGIWRLQITEHKRHWIPAFAGITSKKPIDSDIP